jgi:uncharacterized protein (DUF697 family)
MTRKPLPKAITRPIANLREIAADFVADEQGRVPRQVASADTASFDAVEPEPAVAAPQSRTDLHGATSTAADPQAARRLAAARKIVSRYKTYAAMGGLFPLPIVNIAGVTAINMRMVKALSDLYGLPFRRDRTRATIIGLMGGAVPTGLGAATASTLAFVIPGGALVGLGVSAITAGALTRGIGLVFVDSFENESMSRNVYETKNA